MVLILGRYRDFEDVAIVQVSAYACRERRGWSSRD